MTEWFDGTASATFEDGPCAGLTVEVPAHAGMPPMVLFVRPDGTGPVSASAYAGEPGFVKYLVRSVFGRRRSDEPWAFILYDVDRAAPLRG